MQIGLKINSNTKAFIMKQLPRLIQAINMKVSNNGIEDVLDLRSLIESYQGSDWKDLLKMENGEPVNTVLFQNEQYKLMLICWKGFQRSKKHGHPEGGGLIKVLSGNLLETRFDPADPDRMTGKHYYSEGLVSYIHDSVAYHIVENPYMTPAVSLHLYSPGIYESKVIEPSTSLQSASLQELKTAA